MTGHDEVRAHYREGRFQDAARLCQEVLRQNPEDAEGCRLLGLSLAAMNQFREAIEAYDRALALRPDFFECGFNRANALRSVGDSALALQAYDRVLALRPAHSASWNNRGITLMDLGRFEESIGDFDRVLALQPDHLGALNNRGNALQHVGRFAEAAQCYDQVLARQPDHADCAAHRSFIELLAGDLQTGWRRFEARRQRASWSAPKFPGPELASLEEAAGKSILLYAEQGMGDTIQFCRYAQLLAAHAREVYFLPQPKLPRLLRGLSGVRILGDGDLVSATCDRHLPLLSLPRLFDTAIETIPARVPYLTAEPERIARWSAQIGNAGFRVGIAWQGNPSYPLDRQRSFPLSALAPLAQVPGLRIISLQKHDGTGQLANLPAGLRIENLGEDFDSGPDAFLDTAAAMYACDVVISCDTSIAHLAGALARPVWVALASVPDWRWRLDREDSPWYPTARLFRQSRPGDWSSLFERIADALSAR